MSKHKSARPFVSFKTLNRADLENAAKVRALSFTEVWIINIPSAMTTLTPPGIDELIFPFLNEALMLFYFLSRIHQGKQSKVALVELDNETLCLNPFLFSMSNKKVAQTYPMYL